MTRAPDLRLRHPTPGLLALPWDRPLATWDAGERHEAERSCGAGRAAPFALCELPVGPSRHLVRFARVDGALWALKELPVAVAHREYDVLRTLEERGLPAVRAAGLVEGVGDADTGVLLTRYLTGSWQYRRLFLRLPPNRAAHRARLLDAMAGLLVELHRHGVYWGDCSLANTLFSRDGQLLQAWLVDAETSEVHPSLSDGQRAMDLDILVENVAAGMVDVATWLGRPEELHEVLIAEARRIPERYETLWSVLHQQPVFAFDDRYRVEATARELTDLGFVVDEVRLDPTSTVATDGTERNLVRLRIGTGSRRHHARLLAEIAGVEAGEGQARVLLGDLRAHREALSGTRRVTDGEAAPSWWHDVVVPGTRRAHQAVGHAGSALQAYCDLLEVRWLLSETAGHDVGTEAALAALADRAPVDSAARALVADTASDLPALLPDDPTVTPGT